VLATAGTQVFVNGGSAAPGAVIRNRDTVSTRAASSALVNFTTGGSLQLNANTDPSLSQFVFAARCVIEIVAGVGELYAETDPCDCVFRSPEAETACGSTFAATVEPGRTTIILIAGHMSVRRPVATELQPLEQIVMTRSSIVERRQLDRSELAAAIAWRSQYKYDFGRTKQDQQGIEVPSLLKHTIKEAQALTRKLGFRLRVMSQADSTGTRFIINQDPPPGAILQRGGAVNVWTESVIE
jgi:hypothetical protein